VTRGEEDQQAALTGLLRAAAGGDRQALKSMFDRTSAKLMGICLRILNDREEAEDALQDVYVSVWKRAGSFDPDKASAITWLATIARNRSIDRLRKRRGPLLEEPVEAALEVPDERPDGFAAAAAAEEGSKLQACLGTLEERASSAIRRAFFEGLTYPELAVREGVPLGTMKSWVRRGLQRLKECLER
jgi:RNA polymerase sigma-70 factor (ECF subfamily)